MKLPAIGSLGTIGLDAQQLDRILEAAAKFTEAANRLADALTPTYIVPLADLATAVPPAGSRSHCPACDDTGPHPVNHWKTTYGTAHCAVCSFEFSVPA